MWFQSHRVRKGDFKYSKALSMLYSATELFQSHRVRKGDFKNFAVKTYRNRSVVSISSSEKRGF